MANGYFDAYECSQKSSYNETVNITAVVIKCNNGAMKEVECLGPTCG